LTVSKKRENGALIIHSDYGILSSVDNNGALINYGILTMR